MAMLADEHRRTLVAPPTRPSLAVSPPLGSLIVWPLFLSFGRPASPKPLLFKAVGDGDDGGGELLKMEMSEKWWCGDWCRVVGCVAVGRKCEEEIQCSPA